MFWPQAAKDTNAIVHSNWTLEVYFSVTKAILLKFGALN